jgi:hypothetical protein
MNMKHLSCRAVVCLLGLAVLPLGCGSMEGEVDEAVPFGSAERSIHAWGNYHWPRASQDSAAQLQTVDSVTPAWNTFFATSVSDWSTSTVLDLVATPGDEASSSRKRCRPIQGQIRVCNAAYGRNGWLGLAQIWVDNTGHITQAATKMNDSYFTLATYDTPAWRNLVMCQEVGHAFGLDHQDENNGNANLGTCMDYTNRPAGPPSNEHPNQHDYDELELIYAHADPSTSFSADPAFGAQDIGEDRGELVEHGEATEHWIRPLPRGGELHTFVILARS